MPVQWQADERCAPPDGSHVYNKTFTLTRSITLAVFLFYISFNVAGQGNLQGKWYMFSRNRIIEFNFSKDSLITKQLNWDLSNRERNEQQTQIITRVTEANGNIYLHMQNPGDTTGQTRVNTLRIIHPDKELIFVLNATEKLFTNADSIQQYIKTDLDNKYGMTLYHAAEMQRLRQLKKVAVMSVDDFKKYADKVIHFRTELDSLSNLSNAPDGLMYYSYSMLRIFLGQLGYNPMATNQEYDNFIRQFQNNPATKEIVSKLFE